MSRLPGSNAEVVKDAIPLTSGSVPMGTPASLKVTEPVGVPGAGGAAVAVALIVTGAPKTLELLGRFKLSCDSNVPVDAACTSPLARVAPGMMIPTVAQRTKPAATTDATRKRLPYPPTAPSPGPRTTFHPPPRLVI